MTSSVQSAAAIFGPLLAGFIYNYYQSSTFLVSIVLLVTAFWVMKKFVATDRQPLKDLNAEELISIETL